MSHVVLSPVQHKQSLIRHVSALSSVLVSGKYIELPSESVMQILAARKTVVVSAKI